MRVESNKEIMDAIVFKHEIIDLDSDSELITPESEITSDAPFTIEEVHVVEENVSSCNCAVEELLKKPALERGFSSTLNLIRMGKPLPSINVTGSTKNTSAYRLFKDLYFEKADWLTGCMELNKLFCWPCLLFDLGCGTWNRIGFDDVHNFYKSYKRHENSKSHILASMQLVAFVMNHCDKDISDSEEAISTIKSNRETLKSVIESVCAGGTTHNFVSIKTSQLLRLSGRQSSVFASVPDLHLKIMEAINIQFKKHLVSALNDSPFVSLLLDQISEELVVAVFRYTTCKGELRETFAGFIEVDKELNEIVDKLQKDFDLADKKIVVVMIGSIHHSNISSKNLKYLFLHSPVHRLSNSLEPMLYSIKECTSFFYVIKCFLTWLEDEKIENELKLRVQLFNITKWKDCPVSALYEYMNIVNEVVGMVLNQPVMFSSSSYCSSLVLSHSFNQLDFTFLLRVFNEIFLIVDSLLEMLLSIVPDIKLCSETYSDYVKVISWKKEKFEEFWESVEEIYLGETVVKKLCTEGTSCIKNYYKSLFENVVDIVVGQVTLRLDQIKELDFCYLLDMDSNLENRPETLDKYLISLKNNFGFFNFPRLKNEILIAHAQVDFKKLNCLQLLSHLYQTGLSKPLEQLTLLTRLVIMYPYTNKANCNICPRLFKRIHSFSKAALGKQKHFSWANITIEHRLLNALSLTESFLNEVISTFSVLEPQIPLNYQTFRTV